MASERSAIRRDLAGVGPDPQMAANLQRIGDVRGYRVAEGEPDIRGWEVRTLSGGGVGEVQDLLIDAHRGEVVMLEVDLNDTSDRINIPIRSVQLDRTRNVVIIDSGDLRDARDAAMGDPAVTTRTDDRLADDRLTDDRADVTAREIRYGSMRDASTTEEVIERRPVIEEVVVRRRVVEPGEAEEIG